MDQELKKFHETVILIDDPRVLFGVLTETESFLQQNEINRLSQALLAKFPLDRYKENVEEWLMANKILEKIVQLKEDAIELIRDAKYVQAPKENVKKALKREMRITSPKGNFYLVERFICSIGSCNLYACKLPDGKPGILKIALTKEDNPILDREAVTLNIMHIRAEKLEKANRGEKNLNYDYFMPRLEESFISSEQKERRISVLSFPSLIKDISQLTRISELIENERLCVDPRTGAWMLGKMLKVLEFTYGQGIINKALSNHNFMIERDLHGLIHFDWDNTFINHDGSVPSSVQCSGIISVAKVAIEVMGGNPKNGKLSKSGQLTDDRYEKFLWQLVRGQFDSAAKAHEKFYELIWSLWPREFHPFTSFARK